MAQNTQPIYSLIGDLSYNSSNKMSGALPFTAAANDYTGISTNYVQVFTALTGGSFVQRLRYKALGTNVASVARVFINNGIDSSTLSSGNAFYGELSLPAITASTNAATVDIDYPMNFVVPSGFRIYTGLGTSVAAGWVCTPIAGQYSTV